MNTKEIIPYINQLTELDFSLSISEKELEEKLAIHINHLIKTNFEKLIYILYRMDVSEQKLKQLLATHSNTDAGYIIANLMIERQQQKIKTRQENRGDNTINEDEKW